MFFANVLFTNELSGCLLLSTCLNLIDSCPKSCICFKSSTAMSHKLICVFLQADYVYMDNLSLLEAKGNNENELMTRWAHLHGRQKLISSLCSNVTVERACTPHATATLSSHCLKERKDGKEQQQQTPDIHQVVSLLALFWRNSNINFLLLPE